MSYSVFMCGTPWYHPLKSRIKQATIIYQHFELLHAYSLVYDVDDESGASQGREKHPCFYDASGGFSGGPTHSRMSFHAVHPFSRREALCMLPLPLLPPFSALYRSRPSGAFSAFSSGASFLYSAKQKCYCVLPALLCTALPCTLNTGTNTCKSAIQCNTPLTIICV